MCVCVCVCVCGGGWGCLLASNQVHSAEQISTATVVHVFILSFTLRSSLLLYCLYLCVCICGIDVVCKDEIPANCELTDKNFHGCSEILSRKIN